MILTDWQHRLIAAAVGPFDDPVMTVFVAYAGFGPDDPEAVAFLVRGDTADPVPPDEWCWEAAIRGLRRPWIRCPFVAAVADGDVDRIAGLAGDVEPVVLDQLCTWAQDSIEGRPVLGMDWFQPHGPDLDL